MNILVTGGAGFIGSHVCERLLLEGHAVHAFDALDDYYDPALKRLNLKELSRLKRPFKFIHGDLLDRGALEDAFGHGRYDQVIHLAARAGVRPSFEAPALYQRVNVEGTANVLECARNHDVHKVILASSSSVYGAQAKPPFSEAQPVNSPISPYAASKIALETLGHVYHHANGMDVMVLRFFTVYGPRLRPDLAIYKFTAHIAAGKPIPVFGDGKTFRDYTYISDIVDGVVAATQRKFGYRIINLGGAHPVELERMIGLIESALGTKARIERTSLPPGDMLATWADLTQARALLGYQPRVPIEEGIELFVRWFLKHRR